MFTGQYNQSNELNSTQAPCSPWYHTVDYTPLGILVHHDITTVLLCMHMDTHVMAHGSWSRADLVLCYVMCSLRWRKAIGHYLLEAGVMFTYKWITSFAGALLALLQYNGFNKSQSVHVPGWHQVLKTGRLARYATSRIASSYFSLHPRLGLL